MKEIQSIYDYIFKSSQKTYDLFLETFAEKLRTEELGLYRKWFTDKEIMGTTFDALIGNKNASVAAAITGWNTTAPLSGDDKLAQKTFETLVIQRGKQRTEKELKNIMEAMSQGNASFIINEFYDDVKFVVESIFLAVDSMCLQLLSDGKCSYTQTNNSGGAPVGVVLDYGLDAAQRVNVAASWANPSTADPIKDINTVVKAGQDKGIEYAAILMDDATISNMLNADKVKASIVNIALSGKTATFANVVVGLADFNQLLLRFDLPQIERVKAFVNMENAAGGRSRVRVWKEHIATFVTTSNQGTFNYTRTVEEMNPAFAKAAYVGSVENVTLIQKYETNPVSELTIGKRIGGFSWADSSSVTLLTTVI